MGEARRGGRSLSSASIACRKPGVPGTTTSSGLRKSPRLSRWVARESERSSIASCVDPEGCCAQSDSTLVVRHPPLGNGRSPVEKTVACSVVVRSDSGTERIDNTFAGTNVPNRRSSRLRRRDIGRRRRRYRNTESPKVHVLVVVAVPAAVFLFKMEREPRAAFYGDVFGSRKYGLMGIIAATRSAIDAPSGLLVAVDSEFDRSRPAAVAFLVGEDCIQLQTLVAKVRRYLIERDRCSFIGCS